MDEKSGGQVGKGDYLMSGISNRRRRPKGGRGVAGYDCAQVSKERRIEPDTVSLEALIKK